MPPQWRDPCISSLLVLLLLPLLLSLLLSLPLLLSSPLLLSLPLLLLLSLPLLLLLFLPLLVLRRHSERSEESPHFRGERSDPSAFLFHHPNTPSATHRSTAYPIPFDLLSASRKDRLHNLVYTLQSYREPRSGETRLSTHTASAPNRRLCLCSLFPTPCFSCQAPKPPNPMKTNQI